jgi:Mg-chelatase subunit ChlD
MSHELTNRNFYCPITDELMVDPVMDPDGNTYERAAIIQWLSTHNTSPITRAPLTVNQLIPNRSLRSAIEDELAKQSINVKQNQDNTNIVDPGNVIPIEELSGIEPVSISLTQGDAKYNTAENCTEVDVLVTLSAPTGRGRGSIDVCCVVDISGSMGTQATVPGVEQTGLSLLDIVKHALKTVINSLGPSDRLSVIEFSDQARVVFPLSPMNAAGKARVQQCVDGLRPGGRTNLWDGLVKGMDMLTSGITGGNRNISMFLLTDGEPNIEPPRGHMPMMLRYKNSHGGQYPGVIHTFGFGYTLDSQLLLNIAREGGGEYAFIPDSGFVGTVFVNALSNQLVAFANHSTLSLELRENARYNLEVHILSIKVFTKCYYIYLHVG